MNSVTSKETAHFVKMSTARTKHILATKWQAGIYTNFGVQTTNSLNLSFHLTNELR